MSSRVNTTILGLEGALDIICSHIKQFGWVITLCPVSSFESTFPTLVLYIIVTQKSYATMGHQIALL